MGARGRFRRRRQFTGCPAIRYVSAPRSSNRPDPQQCMQGMEWFLLPEKGTALSGTESDGGSPQRGAYGKPVDPEEAPSSHPTVDAHHTVDRATKKPPAAASRTLKQRPVSAQVAVVQTHKNARPCSVGYAGMNTSASAAVLKQIGGPAPPRRAFVKGGRVSQVDQCRHLKKTQSGMLAVMNNDEAAPHSGATQNGYSGCTTAQIAGAYNTPGSPPAGNLPRKLRGAASLGTITPYHNHSYVLPHQGSKRHGAGLPGSGSSVAAARQASDAAMLELKLAQSLEALGQSEGADAQSSSNKRRMQLFSTLFDRVIERDETFAVLLRRIKVEYDTALKSAVDRSRPSFLEEHEMLRKKVDDFVHANSQLHAENEALKAELSRAQTRELELESHVRALEDHIYSEHKQQLQQLQKQTQQQAHAHAHAHAQSRDEDDPQKIAAELAAEMPASARPGDITPSLGSGRLAAVRPSKPRPACIPAIDMGMVDAVRKQEAEAEATGNVEHNGGGDGGQGADQAERLPDDDDDDDDGDDDDGGGYDDDDDYERLRQRSGALIPPMAAVVRPPALVPMLDMATIQRVSYQEEFDAAEAAAAQ